MKALVVLDTEDFLSDTAPDAQLWWAELLHKRNIKGSFQMVGEMTRKLKRLGRLDTINAIKKHDIGYHSNYHSVHPTTVEGNAGKTLEEAIIWTQNRDASGLAIVKEVFGQPFSYTTPGTSWTPAALIAYGLDNIKVSFISPYATKYKPYWYCGQLNMDYVINFDSIFSPDANIDNYFVKLEASIKKAKENDGVFVIYTHPGRIYTAQHWDICYAKGANPDIDKAPMPPKWPVGHSEIVKKRVEKILDYLQGHPDIEFSDIQSVYKQYLSSKYDLNDILKDADLTIKQATKIPLKKRSAEMPFSNENMRPNYSCWVPHMPDFEPLDVFEQIEGLAYTTRLC
jgi:hypothetical protein